jgi:hypothetical protein
MATLQQIRVMMDLDFWVKDHFQEDRFWEWLEVTDATDGLELLQKLFKCFDLKLVSLLFARYVETFFQEEPTDDPPAEHWYTPDKGSTWVHVETDDEHRNFLLNRLLALVFETDADLFYQLLNIPGVATPAQLEEESYQDKIKRLASEGIPELELANELRAPLSIKEALEEFKHTNSPTIIDVLVVEPLIYDSPSSDSIQRLLAAVKDREQFEGELTFILNSAIVSWDVPFHDAQAVGALAERVKGAISIGLDLLDDAGMRDVARSYETMGLKNLFRLGYSQLVQLQRKTFSIAPEALQRLADSDRSTFALIAGLREPCWMWSVIRNVHSVYGMVQMSARLLMTRLL